MIIVVWWCYWVSSTTTSFPCLFSSPKKIHSQIHCCYCCFHNQFIWFGCSQHVGFFFQKYHPFVQGKNNLIIIIKNGSISATKLKKNPLNHSTNETSKNSFDLIIIIIIVLPTNSIFIVSMWFYVFIFEFYVRVRLIEFSFRIIPK